MWKTISQVIPTKKSKKSHENNLDFDLNELNNHFIQTPQTLVESFGQNFHFEDISSLCEKSFSMPKVTEYDVEEIVNKLDENKSVGCDDISAEHLTRHPSLLPLLTFLIQKSFNDLKVPEVWKTAKVIPLHKNGRKDLLNNYRPISILPTISKIMERIIYNNLYSFLIENKLLSRYQFGFRSGHSCSDALLSIINEIFIKKNEGKKVCVLTIDISKAFDTVCHQILIYKLFRIGLDWNSIIWFNSYLSNCENRNKNFRLKRNVCSCPTREPLRAPLIFNLSE